MKRILPIILFFVGIVCVYWSQNNLFKELGVNPEDFGGFTKKEESDFDVLIKGKKEFKANFKNSLENKNGKLTIDLSVENKSRHDLKKVNVYLRIKQNQKMVYSKSFSKKSLNKNIKLKRKLFFKQVKNVKGKATLSILVVSNEYYKKFNKEIEL